MYLAKMNSSKRMADIGLIVSNYCFGIVKLKGGAETVTEANCNFTICRAHHSPHIAGKAYCTLRHKGSSK